MTSISRAADGAPTAIVAPGGQQTIIQMSAGRLTGVINPASEAYGIAYNEAGLMSDLIDPRRGIHHLTYDARGFGMRAEDPDRPAGLDEQRFVIFERLEGAHDGVEGWPVAGGFAAAAVYNQLVRFFGDLRVEIVVKHAEGGFLLPSFAGDPAAARGVDRGGEAHVPMIPPEAGRLATRRR